MRKIVEILTDKREDIIKGYEDIIKSKDEEIKNLETENTKIGRIAVRLNKYNKYLETEFTKFEQSAKNALREKDDEIKTLEAENTRLKQSAENALREKDEHREEIIDNYIKNTREEDKRIREKKAAKILNNKQKQARLFNAKYDAMDEDGFKIKSHITTNKELKNEKEKYDQYKTDRKLKALKTNGEDDNSATFEEIFEYNLINVRYDLKENDLSYLEVKPVNANPITDEKYEHFMYIKTNEYNKVIIIPISNLGEAQIPQIGYIDDAQLIKHNVANAFSYFIKYYSIKSNDFETNMNLGSKIYNLSAKM